ncbi:MAG: hypothetical protein Q8O42_07565 [Acidobacteriota bacterium]|nr:hypothetical protein [Acidobacteriota bacterium]
MRFTRVVVRAFLVGGSAVAAAVAMTALRQEGGLSPNAWAAVAASLAVFAAMVSAWTSQRMVELQEDALEPNLLVTIDGRSRYQLIQLRLVNLGHSAAFDVTIKWRNGPTVRGGSPVQLGPGGLLPALGPNEHATRLLDVSHQFFARHTDATFVGTISYTNASGQGNHRDIVVSAEHLREAMLHDEELPKTQYELQKLPEKLDKIASEIRKLGKNPNAV